MKKTTNKTTSSSSKVKDDKQVKKIVLLGVGLTATGLAGYFGYQYLKKLKEAESQKSKPISTFTPPETTPTYTPPINNTYTPPVYEEPIYKGSSSNSNTSKPKENSYSSTYTEPKPKSTFPLKRGSKGIKVKELQLALIATYGKSILPKYGADGDFGKELANALKKLKYSATVSESLFHVITGGKTTSFSLAKQFLSALNNSDYVTTMTLLKQLNSKSDYTSVSNEFKGYRLHGGVRQTLVNGTLNTFSDATQKQNIRIEFIRMGLKYNGKKWSLDGLGNINGNKIITTQATQIWLDGFNSMSVPQNMILGTAIAERLDFTLFEKDKRYFLVRTATIKKL
jgi:hypothetical protein